VFTLFRGSSVGIETGYWLDDREAAVRVPVGEKMFTSPYRTDWLWGPPIGYRGLKRPVREADHSPLTSAEVKKTWIYTPTPPIRLHGAVLS
jgi:hypothetical protein